ncbi:hypothetical protein A2Y99_00375 [Candidatus Gottesmanbacteria bacterium RBG_13_37_7]|uniref:Sce7726 family protein n=1 Tax=Candidatus Gottesmanbacteria bacterium RBG_13_37_7 TaxID=1798369 RepID=A0A1F5YH05_9BACT|nr:MAG: hypothetical protein A2Y99_00375 [Candidatus Gottesmanbacteria bacterium RBG_13_37_7]
MNQTNDINIREALFTWLNKEYSAYPEYRIVPELGLWHGAARIDIAVINGVLHGYEIKSDSDTLARLPEQMQAYNAIFDQVTLVVGNKHFIEAFKMVPDWWGIRTAHMESDNSIYFNLIRAPKGNPAQDDISIARLLWKREALDILETIGKANGVRSKPREVVYERLVESMELELLKKHVWSILQSFRQGWRSGVL